MKPASAARTATALPRPAMERLLRDVQADLADYAQLAELLEAQFTGALRHDGAALQALADQVLALVEQLEQRRTLRAGLLARLLDGQAPSVQALLSLWPAASRPAVQALWEQLEQAVRDCQQRNLRNARLMTEQNALLARVLHGQENHDYAHA